MKTITNKDKVTILSKKGMKELRKSIAQLEKDVKKSQQQLHELDKTLGRDERLNRIEKISEIEGYESELEEKRLVLSSARLIPQKRSHLRVAIGSVVDLIDKHGHMFRYRIVESIEANPSDGRISTLSPIGQSLIGKTVRDTIEWTKGSHITRLNLVRIS
ncbi:hypothetical protein HGB25_02235 [Candidatus Saccharibacteria bacterium]|nr:hypothetical protein [Candidatus Saccharibacteria bacterium]